MMAKEPNPLHVARERQLLDRLSQALESGNAVAIESARKALRDFYQKVLS